MAQHKQNLERLNSLDAKYTSLDKNYFELKAMMETVVKTIGNLPDRVDSLESTRDKERGARIAVGLISGALGTGIGLAAHAWPSIVKAFGI